MGLIRKYVERVKRVVFLASLISLERGLAKGWLVSEMSEKCCPFMCNNKKAPAMPFSTPFLGE